MGIFAVAGFLFLLLRPFLGESSAEKEQRLFDALLLKTHGDKDLAQRLVDAERKRNPQGSRKVHIKEALTRWDRDNR
ncbi:MAG: hypothetical protein HY791_33400 [Deltaproteobacteria bacterium]|nr:hypothetical protein [Deltaproteobacteria bacterium]